MSSSSIQCFEANPDISGLGVRISFYVQTIALVLLAGRSLDEALNSVWTLLGTSFGLTISALVTAVRDELPLYQAIIVTDLVWLANYAIFMSLATYNRHPRGSHMVQYAAILQTYISMSCIFYLWSRAPELEAAFDSHTGKTMFVLLFVSTSATGTGRIVAIVVTSLLFIGYSVVATIFIYRRLTFRPSPEHLKLQPRRVSNPPPPASPMSASGAPRDHAAGNRPPPSLSIDPHLITLSFFFGVPYVITVICTELQIDRNRLCSGNSFWGFGQILAMTVTIVPVVITVEAFRKYGWKQRPRVATENAPDGNASLV
ncbi:hypothetical protein DFH09DRAFT_1180077 [Mycena vulgaris]|nr:hypothetical protein DFH09DRAFT_1180077 [Mycena vulgaris]